MGTPTTSVRGSGAKLGYATASGTAPTLLGKLTNVKPMKLKADSTDISNSDSPDDMKEKTPTWGDTEPMSATLIFEKAKTTAALAQWKVVQWWTVTFTDGSKWQCNGFLSELGDVVDVGGVCHTEISIERTSGIPTYTPGT